MPEIVPCSLPAPDASTNNKKPCVVILSLGKAKTLLIPGSIRLPWVLSNKDHKQQLFYLLMICSLERDSGKKSYAQHSHVV